MFGFVEALNWMSLTAPFLIAGGCYDFVLKKINIKAVALFAW